MESFSKAGKGYNYFRNIGHSTLWNKCLDFLNKDLSFTEELFCILKKDRGQRRTQPGSPGHEHWGTFYLTDFEVVKFIGIEKTLSNI